MKFDSPVGKDGKRRKKLAIVGFAESSRHLAPYDDDSWEIHAMNQLYRHIPRATVWWEIHRKEDYLADQVRVTAVEYTTWLKNCPIPVFMCEKDPEVPSSIEYPIEKMAAKYGDYFYSTISYMLAYAIDEGFEEIGIWGVDLSHDTEYEFQKPSAEYFIGIARGKGIKVTIAPQSALVKGMYRYGYQSMPTNEDIQWLTIYKQRVSEKQQEIIGAMNHLQGQLSLAKELTIPQEKLDTIGRDLNTNVAMANLLQGQLNCADEFLSWARSKRRGSAPPDPSLPNPDKAAKESDEQDHARLALVK